MRVALDVCWTGATVVVFVLGLVSARDISPRRVSKAHRDAREYRWRRPERVAGTLVDGRVSLLDRGAQTRRWVRAAR